MAFDGLSSRAVIGMFYEALRQDPGGQVVQALAGDVFSSDQASETYPWIGQSPQLREWVGGRQAKGFYDDSIVVNNKHYEATIEIPRQWALRDKTGQIQQRIAELARRANAHWFKLLCDKLVTGESATGWDGQYFFDTDHSFGSSGTLDNDITASASTTTAPTVAEARTAILKAVEAILGMKDDQGEYVNETDRNFLVFAPLNLWPYLMQAFEQELSGGGDTNILSKAMVMDGYNFSLACSPRLNTWTDRFPVFSLDGTMRPFIRQEESPLSIKAKAEGSEFEFDNDAWQFGVDTWRGLEFGDFRKGCLVTLT